MRAVYARVLITRNRNLINVVTRTGMRGGGGGRGKGEVGRLSRTNARERSMNCPRANQLRNTLPRRWLLRLARSARSKKEKGRREKVHHFPRLF